MNMTLTPTMTMTKRLLSFCAAAALLFPAGRAVRNRALGTPA